MAPTEKQIIKAKLIIAQSSRGKRKTTSKGKDNVPKKTKRKPTTVQWARPRFHHLSDKLLTIIESKARYKQAFGFDKGQDGTVSTGGLTLPDLYDKVAEALFVEPANSTYSTDDIPSLQGVSRTILQHKNPYELKSYREHRDELGATGQGLVETGHQHEITEGSQLANIWDLIQKKFPWYICMHALMGTSLIINLSALAHSQTTVDLSAHKGPISTKDEDSDDNSSKISWAPSDVLKNDEDEDQVLSISSSSPPHQSGHLLATSIPSTPTPKVKTEATTMLATQGTKHKSIHEHELEIATQDCTQRLKVTKVKEQEKTVLSQVKSQAKNTLEMAKMEYSRREAERQHQHELSMLERQIELEQLRRGGPLPEPAFGFRMGPAFGAPPLNAIDPTLFR